MLEESRASQPNNEKNDVDMSGSDDEDGTARPSTSKGKEKNGKLLYTCGTCTNIYMLCTVNLDGSGVLKSPAAKC